ncbi:hypothetical protein BDV95DRAFT_568343 [Massariosphaeria phaeospora]|uniref:Uncharacterized protein n=1 Tax=Massariosphaeria phaeospora TaxID=100035 RepID=A0A7C8I7Z6_9PLEO|nr:hypothetical protein BDV95DRAFT_568343 [Massariosphaeria phaeospora]
MHSSAIIQLLLSFALVAPAVVITRAEVDPDNPQAADPKQPPKTLTAPSGPSNPFQSGFQTAPASCTDFQKPSESCLKDLQAQTGGVVAFSGGQIKWDDDNQCDDTKKGVYQTAMYDAHILATYASTLPDGHNAKDIALWKTWIGPDYITQQQRIVDNLGRASGFLSKTENFDIILSCKDTKGWCNSKKDGKSIGGYAWTYNGWFGWYYYITMCPPFFMMDNMEQKITQIESDLAKGDTTTARGADWQKHTGQYILHEMMHLDSVGKPHILDEKVDPSGVGPSAYGPRLVYKLANRPLNQGGGATRASTNADSYAWFTNSKYFWDLTGYFPAPPSYRNMANIDQFSSEDEVRAQDVWPFHLGDIDQDTSEDEVKKRFDAGVEAMGTTAPPAQQPTAPKPVPDPTCGGSNLNGNFPPGFALSDGQFHTAKDILYRMRDHACQGICSSINDVPGHLSAAKVQNTNGCEYAAKIATDKELYLYASGTQNCYDATEKLINQCWDSEKKDAGWINGPNDNEFYQVGFRAVNGDGSKHDPITDAGFLGHRHVACQRKGSNPFADQYEIYISGWDDANYGKSIQSAMGACKLSVTSWKFEDFDGHGFADGSKSQKIAKFNTVLSNGGCIESKIEQALGLGAGGLDCPYNKVQEPGQF